MSIEAETEAWADTLDAFAKWVRGEGPPVEVASSDGWFKPWESKGYISQYVHGTGTSWRVSPQPDRIRIPSPLTFTEWVNIMKKQDKKTVRTPKTDDKTRVRADSIDAEHNKPFHPGWTEIVAEFLGNTEGKPALVDEAGLADVVRRAAQCGIYACVAPGPTSPFAGLVEQRGLRIKAKNGKKVRKLKRELRRCKDANRLLQSALERELREQMIAQRKNAPGCADDIGVDIMSFFQPLRNKAAAGNISSIGDISIREITPPASPQPEPACGNCADCTCEQPEPVDVHKLGVDVLRNNIRAVSMQIMEDVADAGFAARTTFMLKHLIRNPVEIPKKATTHFIMLMTLRDRLRALINRVENTQKHDIVTDLQLLSHSGFREDDVKRWERMCETVESFR